MKIGVLALQGDFQEHCDLLKSLTIEPVQVRTPHDLQDIVGLIIPGGESTTISRLMKENGLDAALREKISHGMAVYGTCAGAILLADKIKNSPVSTLGLLDIVIERNSYGRQVDSFSERVTVDGVGEFTGIFIRAPRILKAGKNVRVIGRLKGEIVAVLQNKILATTFHPELTESTDMHKFFVRLAEQR